MIRITIKSRIIGCPFPLQLTSFFAPPSKNDTVIDMPSDDARAKQKCEHDWERKTRTQSARHPESGYHVAGDSSATVYASRTTVYMCRRCGEEQEVVGTTEYSEHKD